VPAPSTAALPVVECSFSIDNASFVQCGFSTRCSKLLQAGLYPYPALKKWYMVIIR